MSAVDVAQAAEREAVASKARTSLALGNSGSGGRGAGSRTKGLLMAFKLLDMAQKRWRRLDGRHLLPLVRAGVKFVDGVRREADHRITQSTNSRPRKAA